MKTMANTFAIVSGLEDPPWLTQSERQGPKVVDVKPILHHWLQPDWSVQPFLWMWWFAHPICCTPKVLRKSPSQDLGLSQKPLAHYQDSKSIYHLHNKRLNFFVKKGQVVIWNTMYFWIKFHEITIVFCELAKNWCCLSLLVAKIWKLRDQILS